MKRWPRLSERTWWAAVLLIVAIAAILRFAGLNWDGGAYLHPDERFMVMVTVDTKWPETIAGYFDSANSPLNPYNTQHGTFIYGTFPLYLTKAIGTLTGNDAYGNAHIAGRAFSAVCDTGSVFLTAWIARRFFGKGAGLLAATLIAFTMLHIQSAHFYTVDAPAVFFALATFCCIVHGYDRKSLGWFAFSGVMLGLAAACKPNLLITLAFLGLPVAEQIRTQGFASLMPRRARGFSLLMALPLALLTAFWTFRVAQPYAFAGPGFFGIRLNPQWVNDLKYWSNAQNGLIDVKSSVQWVGRTPMAYILENLIRVGMGYPLGIAALVALAWAVWSLLRSRRWPSWWMLGIVGWTVAQIVLYGLNQAQAQRYLIMVYPFLIVLAAGFLMEIARRARTSPRLRNLPAWSNPGALLIAVTVFYTVFYGIAFDSLYVRPLSRVQGSEWIYENVPPGSVLTSEYWDDPLPMSINGHVINEYRILTLDLYGWEGPGSFKVSTLVNQITQADYIILSSNRVISSVPQQPERYPIANRYYDMLLNGELGFTEVANFTQVPELLGVRFDDVHAEETLTVYEHPQVRIFQKNDSFDPHAIYIQLTEAQGYGGVTYLPGDPVPEKLWMTPAQIDALNEHGTWTDAFSLTGITERFPAVFWYVSLQLLALGSVPLCWRLFRRLPGVGYPMSKVVGLFLVSWLSWWLGTLGILPFGRWMVMLAWLAMVIAGVAVTWRRPRTFFTEISRAWPWIIGTEAIYTLSFIGMAWLRAHNSAFWQSGLPDSTPYWLAMFNGVARSTSFPAADIWASGGTQYAPHWGLIPWAAVTRLAGVNPTAGFTLISAGVMATVCVTVWFAAAALLRRFAPMSRRVGIAALIAPLLVALAGPLSIAPRAGRGEFGYPPASGFLASLGTVGDAVAGAINLAFRAPDPTVDLFTANTQVTTNWMMLTPFSAIASGDISPAVTALPWIALLLAAGVAALLPAEDDDRRIGSIALTDLVRIALVGLAFGAIHASTLWGTLTFLPFITLLVAIVAIGRWPWAHPWPLARGFVLLLIGTLGAAVIGFLPAFAGFANSPRNVVEMPDLTLGAVIPHVWPILAIIALLVFMRSGMAMRSAATAGARSLVIAGMVLTVMLAIAAFVIHLPAALALPLVFAAGLLALIDAAKPWRLVTLAILITGGIALALSLMVPSGSDPFRVAASHQMYPAVWMLLALAAAVGLGAITLAARLSARIVGIVVASLAALVLVAAPLMQTREILADSTTTSLDSSAFMAADQAWAADREAARWMLANVTGMPVILEAQGGDYSMAARFSTITGFPTVLGWQTPERVMRPGWDEITNRRLTAISQIYGSNGDFASIRPLLDQYQVEYIVIGTTERQLYSPIALAKFDEAVKSGGLEQIYNEDGVMILRYQPTPPQN